jgi:hypothetical protein
MDGAAKLNHLLASSGHEQTPLVEAALDAICWIECECDKTPLPPSLVAIRAILAAVVIDFGLFPDKDDEVEFCEFEHRFVQAFQTFQIRMRSARDDREPVSADRFGVA